MDTETPTNPVESKEVRLVDVQVTDQIVALNLIISFLNVAQRRGAYTMDESAKIWECVQQFSAPPTQEQASE
jgi:hypothetical protein